MTTSIRKYSSILFLILSFSLIVQPINLTANAFSDSDPAADARMHAANESGSSWFLIGCLGGFIGYIIATAVTPNPPASAIVGKDEAYVATFSDVYVSEVQSKRKDNAMYGCLVGTGLSVLAYVALIAAAESSAN
ncbi:MAG: hypothetical protein WD098_00090 [Balneolales bacterium]